MFGIAVTIISLIALVVLVLLVIGAVSPSRLRRILPFAGRAFSMKLTLVGLAVIFGALLAVVAVLFSLPRFSSSLPEGDPVIAGESTGITVAVTNAGLRGGVFSSDYAIDGVRQTAVSQYVPGRETHHVVLPLPDDLEAGEHSILVGGARYAIVALRPAAFSVTSLETDTELARTGERVTVTATVKNTGEVPGEFDGVLKADGREYDAQPTEIGPGEQRTLEYVYRSRRQAKHRLSLGDATCSQVVVRPVRYANGHFLRRKVSGGRGVLEVKNGNSGDAVVVMTRNKSRRSAVIACYVAARRSVTISGIPDGRYWIYYTIGKDWNTYTDGFIETHERGRFSDGATYSTKSWTTSWSDARYRYTQGHVRYTRWRISLNRVKGGTARTLPVGEGAFPKVD
jgi:hypothetical protein